MHKVVFSGSDFPNLEKFISVKLPLPLNPGDTIILRILSDNHHTQATLGDTTIKLEPGFRATPSNGGLTLVRVKQCN